VKQGILTDERKRKIFRFHFTFIAILLINQNGGCTKYPSLTSEGGFSLLALPRQNPLSEVKELFCASAILQSEKCQMS
jgi:hypothetical protein